MSRWPDKHFRWGTPGTTADIPPSKRPATCRINGCLAPAGEGEERLCRSHLEAYRQVREYVMSRRVSRDSKGRVFTKRSA